MKKNSIIISVLFILGSTLFAEPKSFNNPGKMPAPKEKGRPTVALVLSGGGINGAAEIPVLEEIDKLGIPVDMVLGTSIGAIVGGLYSCGYTTDQIYDLFFTQNWPDIFADFSSSPYEYLYEDHGIKSNLLPLRTGLDAKLQIGKGITNGQKAYLMLKELTLKYPSNTDFDTLPVPFRAVATDMITGEPYLFSEGDLAEAIRASMNVAGLFEPLYINGHYLLDGGLSYNMPVSIARKMGYDIVIAVEISPSSNKSARTYDSNPLYALQDSIYIPMRTVDKIEAQMADLTIYPDLSKFEITDFEKADEIYAEGKKAVEAASAELKKIRNRIYPTGNYITEKRDIYLKKSNLVPSNIVTINAFHEDEKYIHKLFNEYRKENCSSNAFRTFVEALYNTGHYKLIQARIIQNDNECIMELTMTQNPTPSFMILAGGEIEQSASSEGLASYANANLALQFRGFANPDSLLSLRGTFLHDWNADLLYYQPFSKNSYMKMRSNYQHEIFGTYKQYISWENQFGFGINYKKNAFLENGIFYNLSRTPDNFNTKDKHNNWETGAYLRYNMSLLDQPCFSQKGFYLDSKLKYIIPAGTALDYSNAAVLGNVDIKFAIPFTEKLSLGINGTGNWDFTGNLKNTSGLLILEGCNNYNRIYFPQNSEKDTFSPAMFAASVSLQFAPVDHLTIAGGKLYILATGTWGTMNHLYEGIWTASGGLGLRIFDSCNFLLRIGTGSTTLHKCVPFAALDMGAIKF